tara:strand:+ start:2242 stop:3009 length:768 start_codon:yes stop_codon:yes gene_type:complete
MTKSAPEDIGGLGEALPAHPDRTTVYSSPSMVERRNRILREARKMIAEGGIENFSIRALCRRADVAQRTLYNAFHDKDRIIALAIRQAYDEVNQFIRYRTSADTLEGIVDRLISVNQRNLRAPHYTRAVTSIYFALNTSTDIWNALREMVFLNLHQWLNRLQAENQLQEWVEIDQLASDIANLEYSIIHDWAQGRLDDEEYLMRLIKAVLAHAVGVTVGPAREEATKMLQSIAETEKLPEFPKPVFNPQPETAEG